jgi:hypothetical protein
MPHIFLVGAVCGSGGCALAGRPGRTRAGVETWAVQAQQGTVPNVQGGTQGWTLGLLPLPLTIPGSSPYLDAHRTWTAPVWVGLLHVSFSAHPGTRSCVPEAGLVCALLAVTAQRTLDPVQVVPCGAYCVPLCAWDTYSCTLGSDLSTSRAEGGVFWIFLTRQPAMEVFKVAPHLVWTYQTSPIAGSSIPPFQLVGQNRHAYTVLTRSQRVARRQFVFQALRHSAMQPLGTRWTWPSAPLAAFAGFGESHGRTDTWRAFGAWLVMV